MIPTKQSQKFDKSEPASNSRRRSSEHHEKRGRGRKSSPSKESKTSYNSKSGTASFDALDKRSSASSSTSITTDNSSKSNRKLKKSSLKEKVFEESNSEFSDSSSASAGSPAPHQSNGISLSTIGTFSHAGVAGSMAAEMRLLQDLHSKIASMEDPRKLLEVVEIVESCGRDSYSMDSGVTFDFDLCKLSKAAIKKLQQAILL